MKSVKFGRESVESQGSLAEDSAEKAALVINKTAVDKEERSGLCWDHRHCALNCRHERCEGVPGIGLRSLG